MRSLIGAAIISAGLLSPLWADEGKGKRVLQLAREGKLSEVGSAIAAAIEDARHEEGMHESMVLLAEVLEALKPSDDAERNLSFAPYFARYAFDRWRINGTTLPALRSPLNIPKGMLNSERKAVQQEVAELRRQWARRVEVGNRLGKAMLRHPQTATQGFQLLLGNRKGLDRAEGDFIEDAKRVVAARISWKEKSPQPRDPWSYYHGAELTGPERPATLGLGPIPYLMKFAGKGDEDFDKELIELLGRAEPNRRESLQLLAVVMGGNDRKVTGAMATWKGGLPRKPEARGEAVAELAWGLFMLDLEEGKAMQTVEAVLMAREVARACLPRHPTVYQSLAEWIARERGYEGLRVFLHKLTETMIGIKHTWARFPEDVREGLVPEDLLRGEKALEVFFELLLRGDVIALEALAFIARERLSPILQDAAEHSRYGVWRQLRSPTVAAVVDKIGAVGLWSDDSYDIWGARFGDEGLFYALTLSYILLGEINDLDSRNEVGRALMAAEREDRFLKRLAGALMVRDSSSRNFVIAQLRREAAELRKLPERQLEGLAALLGWWIPEMTLPDADEDTAALLAALSKDGKRGHFRAAEDWLTIGFGEEGSPVDQKKVVMVVTEVMRSDLELAAAVWESYLKDLRRRSAGASQMERCDVGTFIVEAWDSAPLVLFESVVQNRVPAERWIPFLGAIEKSEESDYLGVGICSRALNAALSHAHHALTPELAGAKGKEWLFWLRKHWESLPMQAGQDASEEDRATMACYQGAFLLECGLIKDADEVLAWLEQSDLGERRPFFGRTYQLLALVARAAGEATPQQKDQAKKILAEILADERIPVRPRVMMAHRAAKHRPWLLESGKSASALAKLMSAYDNGKRQIVSQATHSLLSSLSTLPLEGLADECGELAKQYEGALFSPRALRSYSSERGRNPFARPLLLLAAQAGDREAAVRMADQGGKLLVGDVWLLLTLAELGEKELVRQLLPSEKELFKGRLGIHDELLERRWQALRGLAPKDKRYRIDCVIGGMSDSQERLAGPGAKRHERLSGLAGRFREQAPKSGLARLQCLGALAIENAAAELLAAEMRDESKRWTYSQGLNGRPAPPGLHLAQRIILQTLRLTGEEGESVELERHVLPLMELAASGENFVESDAYQAKKLLQRIERVVFISLLRGLGRHPEKAEAALPYTRKVLESYLRSQEHFPDSVMQLAMAQAILVHALAGKGEEYDKMIEDWSPDLQRRWTPIAKLGFHSQIAMVPGSGRTKFKDWTDPSLSPVRAAYLRALFTDEASAKRELKSGQDVFTLMAYQTFSYDDVVSVLRTLPADRAEWDLLGGSLNLLMMLAADGETAMVKKLLRGPGGTFSAQGLPKVDDVLKARSKKLLRIVAPDERYEIECMVAANRSTDEYLKDKGETRFDRLEALARQFATRAPRDEASRLNCLGMLASSPSATKLLRATYLEMSESLTYEVRAGSEKQPSRGEWAEHRVLRCALGMELAEGKTARVRALLMRLHEETKRADGARSEQAWKMLEVLMRDVACTYLYGLVPEREAARLAFADEILDATIALPGGPRVPKIDAVVMSVCAYALLGKGDELTRRVALWPEEKREAWTLARRQGIMIFDELRRSEAHWESEERETERVAVVRALLRDPGTSKREIDHLTALASLVKGRVLTRKELSEVVTSLPQSHPRRAEYLAGVAGIAGWQESNLAHAMDLYEQAEQEAKARGDEASVHLIRAYRAHCLREAGGDPAMAWKYGSAVAVEQLPERDRAWFRKESLIWKKAASE